MLIIEQTLQIKHVFDVSQPNQDTNQSLKIASNTQHMEITYGDY